MQNIFVDSKNSAYFDIEGVLLSKHIDYEPNKLREKGQMYEKNFGGCFGFGNDLFRSGC